jgi:hypothetical protein
MPIAETVLEGRFLAFQWTPFLGICSWPTLLGRCDYQRVSVVVGRRASAQKLQEEEDSSSFGWVVVVASLDFDLQAATWYTWEEQNLY